MQKSYFMDDSSGAHRSPCPRQISFIHGSWKVRGARRESASLVFSEWRGLGLCLPIPDGSPRLSCRAEVTSADTRSGHPRGISMDRLYTHKDIAARLGATRQAIQKRATTENWPIAERRPIRG